MPEFAGADYNRVRDNARLSSQLGRVRQLMQDGEWRSLGEIARLTGDPEASVSAQLRHLRKVRFGAHTVSRRHIGDGLYLYQLTLNQAQLESGQAESNTPTPTATVESPDRPVDVGPGFEVEPAAVG